MVRQISFYTRCQHDQILTLTMECRRDRDRRSGPLALPSTRSFENHLAFFSENKEQFDSTSTSESESAAVEAGSVLEVKEEQFPIVVGPKKTKITASQGLDSSW